MQPNPLQPGQQIGNANDLRIVLHEFCHVLLFGSVHSPNFGFAHSAGDSLAAILCDPGTHAHVADQFKTFPWISAANTGDPNVRDRYHGGNVDNRGDMTIWGWGGTQDLIDVPGGPEYPGYLREQILSMTLFRVYKALGGGSTDLAVQRFAARYMAYLIIQGIFLTPFNEYTPTDLPDEFAGYLMTADSNAVLFNDDFEGAIPGGSISKVIRWGFEKQGCYKLAGVVPANPGEGVAPAIDVYIEDGRHGEYGFTANWQSTEIWNRTSPGDGGGPLLGHQTPDRTKNNDIYVIVRNRGSRPTPPATINVTVQGYYRAALSPDDLVWDDGKWETMTPPAAATQNVTAGGSRTFGPFRWTPLPDLPAGGAISFLMSASVTGDLSNIDPTPSGSFPYRTHTIPLWWLVPFDNNLGQLILNVP